MLVSGGVDQTPVHTSQTLGHEQKRTGLQVDFTMQTEPSLTPTSKIHKRHHTSSKLSKIFQGFQPFTFFRQQKPTQKTRF